MHRIILLGDLPQGRLPVGAYKTIWGESILKKNTHTHALWTFVTVVKSQLGAPFIPQGFLPDSTPFFSVTDPPASIPWELVKDGPRTWVPAVPMGDHDRALHFGLQVDPALAATGVWSISTYIISLSLPPPTYQIRWKICR